MPSELNADEDYKVDEDFRVIAPKFPASVRIAGIIWIVIGSLILIVPAALWASAPAVRIVWKANWEAGTGVDRGAVITFVFVGVLLVFVGLQSLRGVARDTLGNSIASILGGVGPLIGGLLAVIVGVVGATKNERELTAALLLSGGVLLIFGVSLTGAGVLGILGRADYKKWQRWKKEQAMRARETIS